MSRPIYIPCWLIQVLNLYTGFQTEQQDTARIRKWHLRQLQPGWSYKFTVCHSCTHLILAPQWVHELWWLAEQHGDVKKLLMWRGERMGRWWEDPMDMAKQPQSQSRWRLALAENTSNLVAYNSIISHFGKSTAWWKAVAMFGELDKSGVSGDAYSCNSVINAFERGGEWKSACDLWIQMICSSLQPDVITYNTMISACGKTAAWSSAICLLHACLPIQWDVITLNSAMSSYEKVARWSHALALLAFLSATGGDLRADAISYNAVITACARAGRWQIAQEAFAQLGCEHENGFQPSVVTYNAMVAACDWSGRWKQALDVFGMARFSECKDLITYNSAISACDAAGAAGYLHHALTLLSDLKQDSLQGNVVTYTAVISACESGGQWQQALLLLFEMEDVKVLPNIVSYSATISSCEKALRWQLVFFLLARLQSKDLQPNLITYNAVISACEKVGRWREALLVLATSAELYGLDVVSCGAAMSAFEKGRQWQQVAELFCCMQREAIEINLIISCAVLSAAVFSGQWKWTLQLFEIVDGAIEIDVITMDVVLTACHMGGQALKSLTLLQQAESSGLAGLRELSRARVKELACGLSKQDSQTHHHTTWKRVIVSFWMFLAILHVASFSCVQRSLSALRNYYLCSLKGWPSQLKPKVFWRWASAEQDLTELGPHGPHVSLGVSTCLNNFQSPGSIFDNFDDWVCQHSLQHRNMCSNTFNCITRNSSVLVYVGLYFVYPGLHLT